MKKFKSKIRRKRHYIYFIFIITMIFIIYYEYTLTPKIIDISTSKIEEITNIYVKNNIIPADISVDKLIIINKNNNDEILYVDIDSSYANDIMKEVVTNIQNNIFSLNIQDTYLKKNKEYTYVAIPISINNGGFFSNLGPKIPIRLSFYEHAFGNIDIELTDYGINNALVKVILSINLEMKLYIPFNEEKIYKKFELIIASKIINGIVPNIYGGSYKTSSPIYDK